MQRWLGFSVVLTAALAATACGGSAGTSNTGGSGGAGGAGGNVGGSGGSSGGGAGGATGGVGGAGGSVTTGGMGGGGDGGAGGGAVGPQCSDASQCTLVNDCCNCVGIGSGDTAPGCNIPECFAPACSALGVGSNEAQCAAGQCVAGFDCDHTKVACNGLPPDCPAGQTPSVDGLCWGACVPATECASVASCDQCDGGLACVTEVKQIGPSRHCVKLPTQCNGKATCECLGASVCVDPFDTCSADPQGGLSCSCPNC